jgi:starch phosphorylase
LYGQHDAWRRIMRSTIAINGSYLNTQRMLKQYARKAYFPERRQVGTPALELALAYKCRDLGLQLSDAFQSS